MGGAINSVSRSGANTYQASVYEYFKNKDWQGYEVNAPFTFTVPKQEYNYDLKGFTASGAIIKNKLFFFADRLINAHGVDGARGVKKTSSKKALHLIA